jgi:hypothetical protein
MGATRMQSVARKVDKELNGITGSNRIGFVVLAFPFDAPEGARTNYISNADRASMLIALKEIVARFEGRAQDTETKQ